MARFPTVTSFAAGLMERPTSRSTVKVAIDCRTEHGGVIFYEPNDFADNRSVTSRALGDWWPEALRQLSLGEVRRFWVPERMVHSEIEGDIGDLVCDLELFDINGPPRRPIVE